MSDCSIKDVPVFTEMPCELFSNIPYMTLASYRFIWLSTNHLERRLASASNLS